MSERSNQILSETLDEHPASRTLLATEAGFATAYEILADFLDNLDRALASYGVEDRAHQVLWATTDRMLTRMEVGAQRAQEARRKAIELLERGPLDVVTFFREMRLDKGTNVS